MFSGGFEEGYGGAKRAVPGFGMVWIGCQSNPVNMIDPDGQRTIFVHGTWALPKTYSTRFKATISQMFDEDPSNISDIDWSFDRDNDWKWSREIGAHMLFEEILSVPAGEPINIIAHSHGVSVAYLASEMLAEHNLRTGNNVQITNLISISGPAIEEDYRPYMSVIGSLNAVSNQMDGVQINAGLNRKVDLGTIFGMAIMGKKGDRGDAARLLRSQPGVNNILFKEEEVWDYGLGFMAYARAHSFPKEDPRKNRNFWEKEVIPRLNLICP
jgi:hypothetical protein